MKNVLQRVLVLLSALSLLALSTAGCGKKNTDSASGSDSNTGIFPRLGI